MARSASYLHKVTGRKWLSETSSRRRAAASCRSRMRIGIFVHALQWAIGLEWYLAGGRSLADRPQHRSSQRRLVPGLSRDHRLADGPGPSRRDAGTAAGAGARTGRGLGDLTREYSLDEIAIITRAAPCADARPDRTRAISAPAPTPTSPIYAPDDDRQRMFAHAPIRHQGGEVVVDDGELRAVPGGQDQRRSHPGSTMRSCPAMRCLVQPATRSIQFANFAVTEHGPWRTTERWNPGSGARS